MRKGFKILTVIIAVIASAITAGALPRAVNYSFNQIGTNEGLSSSYIKAITQDSNGFMWFGTKNGLNRYDGKTVKCFDCYDRVNKRGNNNISSLYASAEGDVWVGTDRGIYIYNPLFDTFTYLATKSAEGVSADDWVQDIIPDRRGNIWVLVPNQGIFRYYDNDKVDYYPVIRDKVGDKDYLPVSLFVDKDDNVYTGTTRDGLYSYDRAANKFVRMPGFDTLCSETVLLIRQTADGNLALCTPDGKIFHYQLGTGYMTPIPVNEDKDIFARAMICIDNEIWLGTQNGLFIIDMINRDNQTKLLEGGDGKSNLSNSTIYSLYADRDGNAWVGTMYGGVNFFQRKGFKFDRYTSGFGKNTLASKRIRGLSEDGNGKIYIGAEDAGLTGFYPRTGQFEVINDKDIALMIKTFRDTVYVGKARTGMDVYVDGEKVDNRFTDLHGVDETNSVYSFLVDGQGQKWVGSDWGLFRALPGSSRFELVPQLNQAWIFDIVQDSKGIIWFATMGGGVWKYNPSNDKFTHYPFDESHSNGLPTNSISSIMEDSRGTIWFSTDRGGLVKYMPQDDRFESVPGLPDNVVYDILEDSKGYLWFGTNRGLVKYHPETGEIKVFTTADGLLSNQFNYHSALKSKDGWFYFGTMEGLIAFNPEIDTYNDSVPKIFFTALRSGKRELKPGGPDSPLVKSIFYTDKIVLPHNFSPMILEVSTPSYIPQGTLDYTYRMLPNDTTWIPLTDNIITLANLPPATYELQVKVSNGTGYSVRNIEIIVKTPWYSTWWAITLYIVLSGVILLFLWIRYKRNQDRKLAAKEQLFSVNKEKELYENKVQFFTEIAHEIRTPLSLIDAPLEAMESLNIEDKRVERYIKVMRKNTSRLLNLTGQLLDFQKIGANQFNIKFERVDVTQIVNDTIERFEPTMQVKGRELVTSIPQKDIYAVTDSEALIKIFSNLLNNALKYGRHTTEVSLTSDDDTFTLSVTSDGEKLKGENSLRIFEPFFQVNSQQDNNGVGIGLPLCRTLAHLLNGTITLADNNSELNTFVLTLPLRKDDMEAEAVPVTDVTMNEYVMEETVPTSLEQEHSYSILLVEDNDDMREFLADQLSQNFVIDTCCNGQEALDKLQDHNYDLIVTDLMMPVMDGYELCRQVKSDINRSHIPVVFLTAKNDLESKLAALKCGGEAYIEKPFSIKYFRQQILSLLENRKHERKAFLKQPFFSIDNMKMTKADEEFMNKVIKIITDNISDENFSVESMADVFCMSRSSLLRKIKTLFNLSPIELIRLIRLKKAAELIQEGKYRIGDVCFMVGINSSSYFSKLFFRQFGVTPKGFEKQCQQYARNGEAARAPQPEPTDAPDAAEVADDNAPDEHPSPTEEQ